MKNPVIGVGTLTISPRAKQLVMQALNNNRLSYGPMMQQFETEFAGLHNCRFGILSNSGTSALQIALQAMKELHKWQDGDEVLIPAVTFVATANIVLHNRMTPVLVDVEPRYYELNSSLIEEKITSRTRAIIPVHLFGHPADMDPIREIAQQYKLKIIEDSAETMFASYKGQRVGSLGDIGCFSTYVAHLLVTGVGGVNTTNNPEYAIRMRSLMNHGRDSIYLSIDDDKDKFGEELRMIVARRFSFTSVGHSFRITEMEAALGLAQLENWESIITQRRANASFLSRALASFQDRLQLPTIRPNCEHSFMMYPIVLRGQSKQDFVNYLEERGVETRDMLPLTNQPVFKDLLDISEEDYEIAKWINHNGFYIGCHQDLKQIDLEYIIELFERFWRQKRGTFGEGASLILMTQNSESLLKEILDQIPFELFAQVVAFDESSTDDTVKLLTEQKIPVISMNGCGMAELICSDEHDIRYENLIFYPVDGRHDVRDIARLVLLLERGNDMVIASRFIIGGERRGRYQTHRYRSIGNRVFNLLANLLFYGNLSDCLSQFRAVKRSKMATLRLSSKGLPLYYQLSIQAMKKGWRIAEIPTTELVNSEVDNYKLAFRSVFPVLFVMVSEWFRRNS